MSPRIAGATALRVLTQLRRDPRTLALLIVVPCVLEALLKEVFAGRSEVFRTIGPPLLGLFPFISMFLVTSITMLRERTTGTLERLMTMPLAKLDLLAGYGAAFALVAAVQAAAVSAVAFGLLGLDVGGSRLLVAGLAVANAVLGMSLGLFVSAFAATEFHEYISTMLPMARVHVDQAIAVLITGFVIFVAGYLMARLFIRQRPERRQRADAAFFGRFWTRGFRYTLVVLTLLTIVLKSVETLQRIRVAGGVVEFLQHAYLYRFGTGAQTPQEATVVGLASLLGESVVGVIALWIAGAESAGHARELVGALGFPVTPA